MTKSNFNDLMKELQLEYLASFDEKIKNIQTYYEGRDWDSLELEFHKLKGTGSTYGIPEVTTLFEILEKVCRTHKSLEQENIEGTLGLLALIRKKYLEGFPFDLSSQEAFQKIKAL